MEQSFAVLGMGRLGRALAAALAEQGALVHRWNRVAGGAGRLWSGASMESVALDGLAAALLADTVVLAVPDDALAPLADALAAADWAGRTVVHCSGHAGAGVLAPLAARGAIAVAAHPVMAFAGDTTADVRRLAGIGWGVTADGPEGLARGFAFARGLGGRPFAVAPEHRDLYHAALTHAINHLVTLTVQGAELLALAGAPEPGAVLRPAMEAALANALARGAAAATGPVVRGDAGTLAAHNRALADAAPAVLPGYREMTVAGIDLALAGGRITGEQAGRLRAALEPGSASA